MSTNVVITCTRRHSLQAFGSWILNLLFYARLFGLLRLLVFPRRRLLLSLICALLCAYAALRCFRLFGAETKFVDALFVDGIDPVLIQIDDEDQVCACDAPIRTSQPTCAEHDKEDFSTKRSLSS